MEQQRELFEKIALGEIEGKHKAIHAYDHILWRVRSGFLTLFFVGWGFILKGILDKLPSPEDSPEGFSNFLYTFDKMMLPMLFISLGLSIGGFVIDLNYAKRKFRVISALNQVLSGILEYPNIWEGLMSDENQREKLQRLMRVSGDSGDKSYKMKGFSNEFIVTILIYSIPIISVVLGLYIKWFM